MAGLRSGKRLRVITIVISLAAATAAGVGVFLLLAPFSQDDSDPPTCYSIFEWVVPCGGGVSVAAGLATGVVVAIVLFAVGRRR